MSVIVGVSVASCISTVLIVRLFLSPLPLPSLFHHIWYHLTTQMRWPFRCDMAWWDQPMESNYIAFFLIFLYLRQLRIPCWPWWPTTDFYFFSITANCRLTTTLWPNSRNIIMLTCCCSVIVVWCFRLFSFSCCSLFSCSHRAFCSSSLLFFRCSLWFCSCSFDVDDCKLLSSFNSWVTKGGRGVCVNFVYFKNAKYPTFTCLMTNTINN